MSRNEIDKKNREESYSLGKHQAETYLTKAVVKELLVGMKIDKKLHPGHVIYAMGDNQPFCP